MSDALDRYTEWWDGRPLWWRILHRAWWWSLPKWRKAARLARLARVPYDDAMKVVERDSR